MHACFMFQALGLFRAIQRDKLLPITLLPRMDATRPLLIVFEYHYSSFCDVLVAYFYYANQAIRRLSVGAQLRRVCVLTLLILTIQMTIDIGIGRRHRKTLLTSTYSHRSTRRASPSRSVETGSRSPCSEDS
ncbi:hypothetical protein C7974DRAFT_392264 [Boeremia exigua]|uniref:uncharacterized protein n=1 Tax=Boeremia exigua TaxID=749465 RepID=UPI001E8E5ECF|nr:uncharacterized protein C7974DRAFT_392264 [Boeremia exigua]KAH6633161.1 hypothetical protein C7974DRAFT_392264 [Boeremia exigua]